MSEISFSSREAELDKKDIRKKTIVSFLVFFVLFVCGYFAWSWLYNQPKDADKVQPFLRGVFVSNERLFSKFYSANRQAKSFKKSEAVGRVRVNGDVGVGDDFEPATWKLKVARKPGDTLVLTMDDIRALPKT